MATMKIIREVSKEDFEQTKKSKMQYDFEFKIVDGLYYMIATRRNWKDFENAKMKQNVTI